MAIGDLIHMVSSLLATCTRHVARAAKRLRSQQTGAASARLQAVPPARKKKAASILLGGGPTSCYIPFITNSSKKVASKVTGDEDCARASAGKDAEEDAGVWQRTILMGEKCQPLNFSGVIYYDSVGRQLAEIPTPRTPRTPQRGALPPAIASDHLAFDSEEVAK